MIMGGSMVRRNLTRLIALLTMFIVILGTVSCSSWRFRKDDKNSVSDIREVISDAIDSVTARNKRGYLSYCYDSSSEKTSRFFDQYVLFKAYGSDMQNIVKNCLSTAEYSIKADDIVIKDGKADVECKISVVDFGKVLSNGSFKNSSELVKAIRNKKSDIKRSEIILELEYKDYYWYIKNQDELLETICIWKDIKEDDVLAAFENETFEASTVETEETEAENTKLYFDAIADVFWYDCGNLTSGDYSYQNAVSAEVDLLLDPERTGDLDWSAVNYDIIYNDELIDSFLVTEFMKDDKVYICATLRAYDYKKITDRRGYLKEGSLEFRFKTGSGELIVSETCKIECVDKGFQDVSVSYGDSTCIKDIYFSDWYYAYKEILEFDIFLKGKGFTVSYVLLDPEDNIIFEDAVDTEGSFGSIILTPDKCLLNEFEGTYTLECYDEDEKLILSSDVTVDSSYSEGK